MEEKMLILNMLKEEKITTEEALKLLEALDKNAANARPCPSRINEIKDELSSKISEMKIDEKLNRFGEKASRFAETFGEKAGKLAEQLGENINNDKIGSNTEKFTEEFTKRMESLGQDIAEAALKFADSFTGQINSLFETGTEKHKYNSSYTYPVPEKGDIYFNTNNFTIKAIPGNTDEIKVDIFVRSNIPQLVIDEYFRVITESDGLRLSSEFPGRTWGRIDLHLPKGINALSLDTNNAKCEFNDICAEIIRCNTTNGKIIMRKCDAEEIEISSENEMIVLDEVSARTANLRTSNSKIEIEDSRLDNIDAKTSNSAITAHFSRKGTSLTSDYSLKTSNGKINVEMIAPEEFEHMVDAHTTNGNINIDLVNLEYKIDDKNIGIQNDALIKSDNFDTASNKIVFDTNTTNASIIIKNI